jgi:hypothetical protein
MVSSGVQDFTLAYLALGLLGRERDLPRRDLSLRSGGVMQAVATHTSAIRKTESEGTVVLMGRAGHIALGTAATLAFRTTAVGPETLNVMLDALTSPFNAGRVWCSFRYDTYGIFEEHGGCTDAGQPFKLKSDVSGRWTKQACDNQRFLFLSLGKHQPLKGQAQSIVIAPIVATEGNLGVIDIECKRGRGLFTVSDLDYAMLLSVNLGAVLGSF